MKRNSKALFVANAGMIAALYVVLTYIASIAGLASGAIQIRLSECLTILPCLMTSAIPGLGVGCIIANLLFGLGPWDVVLGTVATVLGAVGTRFLKKKPALAWIPPVITNMLIVPAVLLIYHLPDVEVTIPFTQTTISASGYLPLMITVAIGEIISCGILGMLVYKMAKKSLPAISK